MKTRITELLGIRHPFFQAAMSWASSNAPLVIAVSKAGALGVIAAGPMRPEDFRKALADVRAGTDQPYGVNIPLNNPRAAELLDIAAEARIPVMVASQGGPREHLARFRALGTKWLHVVASVEHAKKAEAAGVDALVVDGMEAGGHPPPAEVTTLVLVRRVLKAVKVPVVASGGVADGAGIAALLALGADAVQLGTRFIATPEASVHENYKRAVLAADVDGSTLVARGRLPVRQLRNKFADKFNAAERAGASQAELDAIFAGSSLKQAAIDGDVDWGKVEAGQSAGLVDDLVPAGELVRRLAAELEEAQLRFAQL
ncbi:MAG: NAD(P)H-dependent flavin oxidoreductase [Burkholderiales bacterium]